MVYTEDDVARYYLPYVKKICSGYAYKMSFEDAFSAALEAIVFAIRTYQPGIIDFKSYLNQCVKKFILKEKRYLYEIKRCEHPKVSLDRPVSEDCKVSILDTFYTNGNVLEDTICFKDFVERLPEINRHIFISYIFGYSFDEIIEYYKINNETLYKIVSQIQHAWRSYWTDIPA